MGRGSETQLQVGQNLNDRIQRYNGEATLKECETKIGMNNKSTTVCPTVEDGPK